MGTDIHISTVQWRKHQFEDWQDLVLAKPLEANRNYVSFAILADVRNGYGFAGHKTHEPIKPISEPRGIPSDYPFDIETDYSIGDHSFSWVTLNEIVQWFESNPKEFIISGQCSPDEYELLVKNKTIPSFLCAYTIDVSWPKFEIYVPIKSRTYLLNSWIEQLTPHQKNGEEIRVIFGFDS
jgi:hypothetical protein